MVRKGEILSQAVSGVGDDLLDGARELFEKSESEIAQTQIAFEKKRRAARNKLIYAFSAAVAAACIFIVLGTGLIPMGGNAGMPKVYYDGVRLGADGTAVCVGEQSEPDVAAYSLERGMGQSGTEFTLNIKVRGNFTIQTSSGEFLPDGCNMVSARDEADIVWAVELEDGACFTVAYGDKTEKIELHFDDESGQWMLRTGE